MLLSTTLCILSYGQVKKVEIVERDVHIVIEPVKIDAETIKYTFHQIKLMKTRWYKFNKVGLNIDQVAFSNWNAGGINSFTTLADAKFRRRYSENRFFWDNELLMNYGINVQKGEGMKKTDDRFLIGSTLGYRTSKISDWFYSAKISVNSQFSNGFDYPDKENPISKFMAPGYLNIGLGAEYAPSKEDFNLFLSPLALKSTFVFDKTLSDAGAFGVTPGEKSKTEVGIYVSEQWNKKVFENVDIENRLVLYTEYKTFGNVDVDFEIVANMKVNKYIEAKIGLHTKYDDDIKSADGGPKVQLKQVLGVGVTYSW